MKLSEKIDELRCELAKLAREAETDLVRRYALRNPPPRRLSMYRRTRMLVGKILRKLGFLVEPWLPSLRHFKGSVGARPFIIWALETDRDTLREACKGFEKLLSSSPGWVPILVTDVADFAFFSRLGWLVEYVPEISATAGGYAERKKRYLAWRYRDAPAVPISAGLVDGVQVQELLLD